MFPLSIQSDMFSFGNYVYVWENMKIGNAILNTGIITVGALLLTVVISSLAGYALARIKGRFFNISYQYVVTLMVVPFISCLLMLVRLSTRLSLYNTIWGCILIHTAWHVPFCTFLYTGFMKSIPVELEEAAYIDGCSTFKTYKVAVRMGPQIAYCRLDIDQRRRQRRLVHGAVLHAGNDESSFGKGKKLRHPDIVVHHMQRAAA